MFRSNSYITSCNIVSATAIKKNSTQHCADQKLKESRALNYGQRGHTCGAISANKIEPLSMTLKQTNKRH